MSDVVDQRIGALVPDPGVPGGWRAPWDAKGTEYAPYCAQDVLTVVDQQRAAVLEKRARVLVDTHASSE